MGDFATATARRDSLMFKRFGELADLYRSNAKDVLGITVIVTRDVEIVGGNGLAMAKHIIVDFKKSDIDCVTDGDVLKLSTGERLTLRETLSDDGNVIQRFARPVNG